MSMVVFPQTVLVMHARPDRQWKGNAAGKIKYVIGFKTAKTGEMIGKKGACPEISSHHCFSGGCPHKGAKEHRVVEDTSKELCILR